MHGNVIPTGIHEEKIVEFFGSCNLSGFAELNELENLTIVCFTNRCGSTYLCSVLTELGLAGRPLETNYEFLNFDAVINISTERKLSNFQEYLQHIINFHSINKNILIKASVDQLNFLIKIGFFDLLKKRPKIIYVRRQDVIAQAVSYVVAFQEERWTSLDDSGFDESIGLRFDELQILNVAKEIYIQNSCFELILKFHEFCHLTLDYEEFASDKEFLVRKLQNYFEIPLVKPSEPNLLPVERQDSPLKRSWIAKIRSRGKGIWTPKVKSDVKLDVPPIDDPQPPLRSPEHGVSQLRQLSELGQSDLPRMAQLINKSTNMADKRDTRVGHLWVINNDKPIADAVDAYGEWAQIEIEFLTQFLPDEGLILDIGSHIGIHATAFAKAAPNTIVHAFEPQPQIAAILQRNALTCGPRIIVHPFAVGGSSGKGFIQNLSFAQPVNGGAQKVLLSHHADDIEIDILSIDDLDLHDVRFMKLDIEGHEAAALRGGKITISRDRPVIFCEVNSIEAAANLLREMEPHSYHAYFITTSAYNPDNYLNNLENFFGVAHECGLLFIRKEQPAPQRMRTTVCVRVQTVDDLAQLFIQAPRYGDETNHDRNAAILVRQLKDKSSAEQALRLEQARLKQLLGDNASVEQMLRLEYEGLKRQLQDMTSAEQALRLEYAVSEEAVNRTNAKLQVAAARYSAMAEFIWKSDVSARRHSVLGTISRKISNTKLSTTCRALSRSGLFDRNWYKRTYTDVSASMLEPVAHYVLFGAFEGRWPNRAFDSAFYLNTNSDVLSSGLNPLLHYVKYGEKEYRRPSEDFDPLIYQQQNPSIDCSKTSLLKHYLDSGHSLKPIKPAFRPRAPEWSVFEDLRSNMPKGKALPAVDVIIPVYRGLADTLACIASVLSSSNATSFELIVIDDQSPDRELSNSLDRLSKMGLITLMRNKRNLGFVGTVNRGMALHKDRDVLLLNSDTLVFHDWLDRLRFHGTKSDVASVTPFTNNGTICSYPEFVKDNPEELEISFADLDALAAKVNKKVSVTVPTGVGFCMYIARRALDLIGPFDEDAFGKGYGEENDFCVRAAQIGLSNLHAFDVFVFHSGETSFAEGSPIAKKKGLEALLKKHPKYPEMVRGFVELDPARMARAKLDIARLLKGAPSRISFCFTHTLGGGIKRYLKDRADRLEENGEYLLLAVPVSPGASRLRITSIHGRNYFPNIDDFDLTGDLLPLADFLCSLGVSNIEIHSTVGWSVSILHAIPRLAQICGLEFDFMVHDYVPLCPQINLINETEVYCGEQGEEQCSRCLLAKPRQVLNIHADATITDMQNIEGWRAAYARFLSLARDVIAPSTDTAERLQRYFPQIQPTVLPHTENLDLIARRVVRRFDGGILRVAIIGAIGPHKGSDVLFKCAVDALQRKLPLEFVVVGYTNIDLSTLPSNLTVTGSYKEDEVFDRLDEQKAHVALLPSVWPETYCYTLTSAIAAGFPVYAFDFGAPATRLRGNPANVLMPLSMISSPQQVNDLLLQFGSHQ